jgi:hypothetical protein
MFRTRSLSVVPVVVLALLGCGKVKSLIGGGSAAVADGGGDASAAPAAANNGPDAPCQSSGRKVWAKWANPTTGLTARTLGSKLAVGVGIGAQPEVLLFDKQGNGELSKVSLPAGSELAKNISATSGSRVLQRVTPVTGPNGEASAYADYHDDYNDKKRRRVACELVSNRHLLIGFDDKPLLGGEEEQAPKDAGAPAKPDAGTLSVGQIAAAARRLRVPGGLKVAAPTAKPAAAPSAAPAPAPAPAAAPEKAEKKKPLREIRECRSFVDDDGYVWAAGSELYGEPQADDSVKWSMRYFVSPNAGGGYYLLSSQALGKQPKTLYTYEAATAAPLPDNSFVLTARYRGALMLWTLSKAHKPVGRNKTYSGGNPTRAEFFSDDKGLVLLTSQNVSSNRFELRFGRCDGSKLPASLEQPGIIGSDPSLSEPNVVMIDGQRWLSYNEGPRHESSLHLIPVDADLKSAGKPFEVVGGSDTVSESAIYTLDGGKILVVYITSAKSGSELASETLSCKAKS